ncbi:glycogen debranching protein GlgX [Teredinibacter purpureus]|uniref:glycogen debranching protein GlgX n=1 Tax=Teredinibacter purpureus TaxID=2731756 RepID=UPI0005F85C3E|nr:glycogen debranching protein GlgX [Teredinibacter purpureus]
MNKFTQTKQFVTREGSSYPLGASCLEGGVNFALFSAHASSVELCLFDELGRMELARITMDAQTDQVWHVFVEGLPSGALYGYRVHGAYEPQRGHRFNPHKLLLDPYAKQIDGLFRWVPGVYGYDLDSPHQDLVLDTRDNAAEVPKCVVVSEEDLSIQDLPHPAHNKPNIPRNEMVVYETHVKGFSQLNLDVPAHDRGSYAGLAHPKVLAYLKNLGITSIELLPVHGFIDEYFLQSHGLSNYWGYNSLHFFSPHAGYSGSGRPVEFKRMVSAVHEAGMEVILDVVYNHTAEGNHLGPTLSFRGIDNASYYALQAHDQRFYVNDTGCGNTLNVRHPRVLQMVMDSLRYWAGEMGVDGFRFDLATVLGRESYGFDAGSGFFDALRQDPVLANVKLIAEPWDIGPGGYQLGNYPSGWCEWNDRYRDTCRKFWKGEPGVLPEFARRIHGSSDLFEHSGRTPSSSINFVTSHDGFTLHDLVSYREKHNERNKEQNRDGHHANFSENYGVEGKTTDIKIGSIRRRQKRNILATLFLSQGTPMLLAGDELGKTQKGNNNAYCQDNDITWIDWQALTEEDKELQEYVSYIISIRQQYPLLTFPRYIHRPDEPNSNIKCAVRWVNTAGEEMKESHWTEQNVNTLGWILERYPVDDAALSEGKSRLLVLFNSGLSDVDFRIPIGTPDADGIEALYWEAKIDTKQEKGIPVIPRFEKGGMITLPAQSLQLLVAVFEH